METLWVCDMGGGSPWSFRGAGASKPGAAPGLEETGQHLEGGAAGPEELVPIDALLTGPRGRARGGGGETRPRDLAGRVRESGEGLLGVSGSH